MRSKPQDSGSPLSLDEPLKAEIISRIVQSLSLQSDLRQKAELAGKLVYAAIEPYVRGPAADESISITEPARSQAPAVDVIELRRCSAGLCKLACGGGAAEQTSERTGPG